MNGGADLLCVPTLLSTHVREQRIVTVILKSMDYFPPQINKIRGPEIFEENKEYVKEQDKWKYRAHIIQRTVEDFKK